MKKIKFAGVVVLSMAVANLGFAARPIAQWDVVPHQRVSGVFKAGVLAFHMDGVKVDFSVGGKAFTAANPTLNDRTGVWEFVFPIDTASLGDGPLVVKAKATSLGRKPESYDLPDLQLYANNQGTLTVAASVWCDSAAGDDANDGSEAKPFKTIAKALAKVAEGGTVHLKKGSYSADKLGIRASRKYWTTIAAANGESPATVEVAGGRPAVDKLKWQNLTLFTENPEGYGVILSGEGGQSMCWTDNCVMRNKQYSKFCRAVPFGNRMIAYVTGGETREIGNGPAAELMRGHVVHDIRCAAFPSRVVVNSKAYNVDGGIASQRDSSCFCSYWCKDPDWCDGAILYNVAGWDCVCAGFVGERLRNCAFVNVSFAFKPADGYQALSQYCDEMENVLFLHVTLVDQALVFREDMSKGKLPFRPKAVHVRNCFAPMIGGMKKTDGSAGLTVGNNAYCPSTDPVAKKGAKTKTKLYGSNAVSAKRLYVDEKKHNYAPKSGSAALKGGMPLQCVPADINGVPYPKGSKRPCGAYAK